jgi:hypothetical protein
MCTTAQYARFPDAFIILSHTSSMLILWQIPEKVDIVISTVTRETIASTVET